MLTEGGGRRAGTASPAEADGSSAEGGSKTSPIRDANFSAQGLLTPPHVGHRFLGRLLSAVPLLPPAGGDVPRHTPH
eukprot:9456178-Pyramimonas_sp.AAC.1